MYISSSEATFEGLSMNDNTAADEVQDIFNSESSISCSGTSCTAGQYSKQCNVALSNDINLQCPINCNKVCLARPASLVHEYSVSGGKFCDKPSH